MFAAGILRRKLGQCAFGPAFKKNYSETKGPKNIYMWGGGLGKLQGGLKEEEYFTTVNQTLIGKLREKTAVADFLPNWDEYHKVINNDALYNTSLMNKHKNVREEAFFMSETSDNFKILHERNKKQEESTLEDNADLLATMKARIE